jgi:hypothetical protein
METKMIKRRDFLIRSTTALTIATSFGDSARAAPLRPLRAKPTVRTLFARPRQQGDYLLITDSTPFPRPLIKEEVVERFFGSGTFDTLSQADHWCMISAGWFEGEDLFTPQPNRDSSYVTWCAVYRPEVEAYDLLMDIFSERVFSPVGLYAPEFGLRLGEHPSSPRYATATIEDASALIELASYVACQSDRVTINPSPLDPNNTAHNHDLLRATTISGEGIR